MRRISDQKKIEIPLTIKKKQLDTIDKALDFTGGHRNDFIVDWALYGAQEELNEKRKIIQKNQKNDIPASMFETLEKEKEKIDAMRKDFLEVQIYTD